MKSKLSGKDRRTLPVMPANVLEMVEAQTIRIGVRLRHARLAMGMNMKEVATMIACSESFISKLENDKVHPSLSILHRLVAALNINVSSLFSDVDPVDDPVLVMRAGTRPLIRTNPPRRGEGVTLERLVPHSRGVLLQANIHIVLPKGSSHGLIEHAGEEFGFVLEGMLNLVVDGVTYTMNAGDSFFFSSHLPHGYHNPGKKIARVLWMNTPPTF